MIRQRAVNVNGKTEKRVVLIEEYWNSLDEKPDMTFKEFESVCKTPFKHARSRLSEEVLYDIRFRYLGQFTPSSSSILKMLKLMDKRLAAEHMSQKIYDKRVKTMVDYIRKRPDKFRRKKEELSKWISL